MPHHGTRQSSRRGAAPVVGFDDALNHRQAHDVLGQELHEAHTFDSLEHLHGLAQAGAHMAAQVHLGGVSGDNGARPLAEAGEKHEHLLGGGVLRLVENDEGVFERAPAHVG